MAEGDESAPRPNPGNRPGAPWRAAGFVLAVMGIVLVAVTPNPPTSLAHWMQVVGGASVTGFLTTYAGWHELVRRRLRGPGTRAMRWMVRRRVAVGTAVVLTAALAVGVPPAWEFARGISIAVAGCAPATQLRMAASRETATTARQLASAYERWTAAENHDCPTVDVYVYAVDGREIAARIRSEEGWSDGSGALQELGPRPDVWLATTSHETAGLDPRAGAATPIATSPLVLAVPAATADREAGETGRWQEVFETFTAGGRGVVRADPDGSELGLLATALLYGQADDPATRPLGPAAVEARLAATLDEGFPLGDTGELLCRHRLLGSTAAVVASEQLVIRFNRGEPFGGPCRSEPGGPGFVALYPSDTRGLDHQFVRLGWSPAPQAEAAAAFGAWLSSAPGKKAIVGTGLRPTGTFTVGPSLTTDGVDDGVTVSAQPVPGEVWTAAAEAHEQAQRRGRALFAVDVSGSMATAGPEGRRADLAAAAVMSALEGMGPRDEFGLWFFPDATGTGHREAVPFGPPDVNRLAAASRLLAGAAPAGGTPLYRTMADAAAALTRADQTRADESRTDAVILLTDGEDTSSDLTAAAVGEMLRGNGVRLIVVTIGEVRCSDPGLGTVTTATGGTCIDADLANLDSAMSEATGGLWGGGR